MSTEEETTTTQLPSSGEEQVAAAATTNTMATPAENPNPQVENEQQQQHVPQPPPQPKRTPEEIIEAFKSSVGAGGGNTSSSQQPLATRNENESNTTTTASVAGLKTGSMKKKRKTSISSQQPQQQQQQQEDASGLNDSMNKNDDTTNTNPEGGRRFSWDRHFAAQSFGANVESKFDILAQSKNPQPQELEQETGSEAGTATDGNATQKKQRKKKKVAKKAPALETANTIEQQQHQNSDHLAPEASSEGPTFNTNKRKKLTTNNKHNNANNAQQDPHLSTPIRNNNANRMMGSPNFNPQEAAAQQQQGQQQQQQQQPHLAVLVRNMSTLEENASIAFVCTRVWVVDRNSGESYNNAVYQPSVNQQGQQQQAHLVAIPVVTFPFDIRRRFSTQPEFNQILDIPTSLPLYNAPNAVLLFEVLSLGNETIRGEVDYSFPPDHHELIAWGFLDLFGPTGDSNEGQDQIVQLFRPSHSRSIWWSAALLGMSLIKPTPQSQVQVPQPLEQQMNNPAIPQIFHEYASSFNRNDLYPGSLCVQFQHPVNNSNNSDTNNNNVLQSLSWRTLGGGSGISRLDTRDFMSLLQAEKVVHRVAWKTNGQTPGLYDSNSSKSPQQATSVDGAGVIINNMVDSAEALAKGISDNVANSTRGSRSATASQSQNLFATATSTLRRQNDAKERRKQRRHEALLRDNSFKREVVERCLPPNTMLHRLEIAGEITAMAIHQKIIALAITSDFKSFICFYDMLLPNMPLVGTVPGHLDYVHALKFERQGRLLVSASSDKTVRVWKTDQFGFFVKTESEEAAVCRYTLPHPFHVYDFDFIGSNALVTCGFDSRIYLWSMQTGLLIGTAENPNEAFFKNICSGGAVADSKLYALDSDFVLSTWRPVEDERTHNVNNLVLRLRVRVPGALSLVVRHSTVVLQCLDNPEEILSATNNNNNDGSSNGGNTNNNPHAFSASGSFAKSAMSIVVVDASLLTLIYKISLNSFISPSLGNNNKTRQQDSAASLRGLGAKSGSAFFMSNAGRPETFITPDGRLIGYADQASRLLFFDAVTGELFSSHSGVPLPGASDVPLSCLSWSRDLHLCVTASALAHTDQGRITEIVVAGRPRVDGEECSDETRTDAVRAMFGGDLTAAARRGFAPTHQSNMMSSPSHRGGFGDDDNNNSVPRTFPTSNSSFSRFGGASSSYFPHDDPVPLRSHEPSLKMHQIVSHWKDMVVKRQASQASFGRSASANTSVVMAGNERPAVVNNNNDDS